MSINQTLIWPADVEPTSKTLAETVSHRLHSDILLCRLKPGEPLRIEKLMESYEAGMSPVREALSRLVSTGLVVAQGQRGFRVAPVSIDDFLDLTRVSVWVEAVALRSSITHGDRDWEAEILAADHRLNGGPTASFGRGMARTWDENWDGYHRAFHGALVAACDSPRLLAQRDHLYDLHDRYRRLALASAHMHEDLEAAHKGLAQAVLRRDAPLAIELFTDHCLHAAKAILLMDKEVGKNAKALIDTLRSSILAGTQMGPPSQKDPSDQRRSRR